MLLSASVCISLLCIRSMFVFLPPPTLSFHLSVSRFARSISVFQSWPVVLEESCDECGSGQIDLGDNPCFLVAKIHQRLMRRPTGPVIQHSRWVFVMRLWVDRTKTRAAHAGFVLRSPRWVFLSPPGTAEISHLDFFFSTCPLSYFASFSFLFYSVFYFFLPIVPLCLQGHCGLNDVLKPRLLCESSAADRVIQHLTHLQLSLHHLQLNSLLACLAKGVWTPLSN